MSIASRSWTAAQFNATLLDRGPPGAHRTTLVLFYSPQCGHCHAMMPEWERLTALIAPPLDNAFKVDATAETGLASRLDVSGYPTLLLFKHDASVYEHGGERTAEDFLAFVNGTAPSKRRGYLGHDGRIHPYVSDTMMQLPREASEILSYARETSMPAAALLALMLVLLGGLIARLLTPSPPPQFLVVPVPPHAKAGEAFPVEFTERGGLFGRGRRRVMSVQAPQGVRQGGSFFVPLVQPPEVRPLDPTPSGAPSSSRGGDSSSRAKAE